MLLSKEVVLKWSGHIKKKYVNKGYLFTEIGDEFIVKIEDIPTQAHIDVECECDICGKTFSKKYYAYTKSFNNGGIVRCDECKSLNRKKLKPKYSYEDIKNKCEELGFELISEEIGTFKDYVQVRCYNHYDIVQTKRISEFFRNSGCKYCSVEKDRHSYEYIKSLFEEKGYTLLAKTYKNAKTELEFICNKHPEEVQKTNFIEISKYKTCKFCKSEEQSKRQRHDIEFIKQYFEENDCILISKEYKNNRYKLEYICNKHRDIGIQTTTYHDFRLSKGCSKCAIEKRSGENHPFYNPNLSPKERLRIRNDYGYNEWRKNVYIRDNWTCQICGLHNGKINAHHLYGYTENPDKRTDINNGVCLCPDCHREFHIKYTKINNTKEQYEEFKLQKLNM